MSPPARMACLALLAALCLSLGSVVDGAYCKGEPDPNAPPNLHPVTSLRAQFLRAVPNGQLWQVQVDDQMIPVVHVWGTPYEKGYAHGELMKQQVNQFIGEVLAYMINEAATALNKSGVPWEDAVPIATQALEIGLDLTSANTEPFQGPHFNEELRGMADASGMPFDSLRRVQMLGELNKGSCSMFGAWDQAIEGGHGLITMRSLDWIMDGPFQNYHQLTVYHADPRNPKENTFVNMGWTGWVGSITGVNEHQLSIHEIGVYFPDEQFGKARDAGIAFTYILRDILQFDRTRLDGLSRLASAQRTCPLILGVGDGKERRMNSVAYSGELCLIMDDSNQQPVADWHPSINNTVYHGMDWLCPGFNRVLGEQLARHWGRLTPELAIRDLLPRTETGSLHAYVADLPNDRLFVSFSAADKSASPNRKAYARQWARIDLRDLFGVQQQQQQQDLPPTLPGRKQPERLISLE